MFLGAVAAGTFVGGPIGDRIGRKPVIWFSILGAAPFTLLLPYASLFWTGVLTVLIGLILASAFSAILVYAQELLPGRSGMVAGMFFGFAFGLGGLGAAPLGELGRSHQHRVRLPRLLVPAADRPAGGVAAEPGAKQSALARVRASTHGGSTRGVYLAACRSYSTAGSS